MPAGDTDDSETLQEQGVAAVAGANPSPGWQVQWKMKRLFICDGSLCCQDRIVLFRPPVAQVLEGHLGEALRSHDNASRYGSYCELFFFLIKKEPAKEEALVALLSVCVITRGQWSVGSAMRMKQTEKL